MTRIADIVTHLAEARHLPPEEYAVLLSPSLAPDDVALLTAKARAVTDSIFGRKVRIRGLLEITNVCRNNCLYCGLRKGNSTLRRYTMSDNAIIASCRKAHDAGFRTFVLQGGENPAFSQARVTLLVREIHTLFPDTAITLSLGEWPDEAYAAFREAGATRYLLRHETHDETHYRRLHPPEMSLRNRLRCLDTLKRLGYQTGTGIMVGSPWQTTANIIEDLEYMHRLQPEMIGIGPFIPASSTPFAGFECGSVPLTTRLTSILRLMFPYANIPSTTATATLDCNGHAGSLLAGANVVMPNITPPDCRKNYSIYDNKASSGSEAAEGLDRLHEILRHIGLEITAERGDYQNNTSSCTILNQA